MKNILNKIAKAIWHTEGMDERVTPDDLQAQFTLYYNKLVIGYLSINQEKWVFEYSEEFKEQGEILPLSNFPNKEFRQEPAIPGKKEEIAFMYLSMNFRL